MKPEINEINGVWERFKGADGWLLKDY